MWQAFRYGGIVVLKRGRKRSPGQLFTRDNIERRGGPELWVETDGAITQERRPEGVVDQLYKIPMPRWAKAMRLR